ncbi:MAG: DUF2764 family protein [Bacteroidaceae bacterium]|nr:DUF2764 family protein [Bacteroidaceae bacterium]
MSDYYCLVAGLPEVAFDGGKLNFSIENFKEEVYPRLSSDDAEKIDLFFLAWDNENLLKLLQNGTETKLERLGCYTREELNEIIFTCKEGDSRRNNIPSYIYDFLEYYFENEAREGIIWSDVLAAHYFSYATLSSNKFIADWFNFNLNVNNLLVALLARKYKLNVAECIIGNNDVAESIRTSGARDFGLAGTLDYLDTVIRLSENDKLKEREHQLDELRWNWLDDNSVFNYFTVERIFVFLQKLDIIARWTKLDEEQGMQRYKEMIEDLKGDKLQIAKL